MSSKKGSSKPAAGAGAGGPGSGAGAAASAGPAAPAVRPKRKPILHGGQISYKVAETTVLGLAVMPHEKTPQTLLADLARNQGRPRPEYHRCAPPRGGGAGVCYRAVLRDAKRPGSDKDLVFMPTAAFEDDDAARAAAPNSRDTSSSRRTTRASASRIASALTRAT